MNDADLALARGRTYGLLGRLLLDGFAGPALETARALPALADALPDVDHDQLAARHYQAFGLGIPPYVDLFLGPDGTLGGERAAAARDLLAETGLSESRTDVEADHLGLLLRAVGFLCAAEADALRDHEARAALEARALQRRLLDALLLPVWAPFLVAVSRLGLPEWRAVVELAAELLGSHRQALGGDVVQADLPDVGQDLLDDDKTGLKRIARHLILPARAGLWISRHDLDALAKAAGVPHGFGDRFKMLESLILSGVDHHQVERVLDALRDVIAAWQRGLDEAEGLGLPVGAWRERLGRTEGIVVRMRAGVAG